MHARRRSMHGGTPPSLARLVGQTEVHHTGTPFARAIERAQVHVSPSTIVLLSVAQRDHRSLGSTRPSRAHGDSDARNALLYGTVRSDGVSALAVLSAATTRLPRD